MSENGRGLSWDDLEDEGFTIFGQSSGRTTPNIGADATLYGYDPMGGLRGLNMGVSPYMLGAGISGITGNDVPGQTFMENRDDEPGAFSQLGDAIAGGAGKVGGALSRGVGAVGNFIGWGDMQPMEKAQVLAAGIGGISDIYSSYRQGKIEDEERKRRQRSAEALRPMYEHLIRGMR